MKNFKILGVVVLAITLASLFTSCNKNNILYGGDYNMTATVDLGGSFLVLGVSNIDFSKDEFTAEIETTTIGGVSEVHTIIINGTMDEAGVLVISEETFTLETGGITETVTVNGEILSSGLIFSGDGTVRVTTSAGTVLGTFYVEGIKM